MCFCAPSKSSSLLYGKRFSLLPINYHSNIIKVSRHSPRYFFLRAWFFLLVTPMVIRFDFCSFAIFTDCAQSCTAWEFLFIQTYSATKMSIPFPFVTGSCRLTDLKILLVCNNNVYFLSIRINSIIWLVWLEKALLVYHSKTYAFGSMQ